jgi:hypothetical protein
VADFSTGDSYAVIVIKVGRSELRTERPVSWATRQKFTIQGLCRGVLLGSMGQGEQ